MVVLSALAISLVFTAIRRMGIRRYCSWGGQENQNSSWTTGITKAIHSSKTFCYNNQIFGIGFDSNCIFLCRYPLTGYQAFCMCLASMDAKLCCTV